MPFFFNLLSLLVLGNEGSTRPGFLPCEKIPSAFSLGTCHRHTMLAVMMKQLLKLSAWDSLCLHTYRESSNGRCQCTGVPMLLMPGREQWLYSPVFLIYRAALASACALAGPWWYSTDICLLGAERHFEYKINAALPLSSANSESQDPDHNFILGLLWNTGTNITRKKSESRSNPTTGHLLRAEISRSNHEHNNAHHPFTLLKSKDWVLSSLQQGDRIPTFWQSREIGSMTCPVPLCYFQKCRPHSLNEISFLYSLQKRCYQAACH